jgi:hypothetical protein
VSIIDRVRSWFSRSEIHQLDYDQKHQEYKDSHHYTEHPQPTMQNRIEHTG